VQIDAEWTLTPADQPAATIGTGRCQPTLTECPACRNNLAMCMAVRAADQQFGCTTTGAGLVQPGHCPKCGWQWDHHGGYGHCPVTLADKSSDAPARRRDLDED
jgi:hypothetical protein